MNEEHEQTQFGVEIMSKWICCISVFLLPAGCSGDYNYVQISNGKVSAPDKRPEVVQLDVDGVESGNCTGTLVGTHLILTAAHCAASKTVSYLGIAAGLKIMPDEWRRNPAVGNFDLALVVFDQKIADVGRIATLGSRPPAIGERIWVAGFGDNDLINDTGSGTLREGANTVDAINDNFISISGLATASSETVKLGEESHCGKGDSGGPMYIAEVVDGSWKRRQVGVCSGGSNEKSYYINLMSSPINAWLCTAQTASGHKVFGLECK